MVVSRDAELVESAARALTDARINGTRLHDLGKFAPRNVSDAHKIAERHAELLDYAVAGWKVGCTSAEAMQILNSPEPFAGRVFAGDVLTSGEVGFSDLVEPSVECEFAFFLGSDLPSGKLDYTAAEVKAATKSVAPALEIVDSRFYDMTSVGYLSLIADSGVNAGAVIGEPVPVDHVPELRSINVRCDIDGEEVSSGSGADILGDPWMALEWVAKHLAESGMALRAGQFVLSGTCTGLARVELGSTVRADFGDFGEVSFTRGVAT